MMKKYKKGIKKQNKTKQNMSVLQAKCLQRFTCSYELEGRLNTVE